MKTKFNKLYFLPFAFWVLFGLSCSDDPGSPEIELTFMEKLQNIPGLEINEITQAAGFERSFELILQQPVDHNNPGGQQFSQRMYLHHVNEEAPFIFCASGYTSRPDYIYDLTSALNANQLQVTHRYMADARPEPTNWQFLTIEQAAADHHRIARFFKEIYEGKWLSLGRSKSGMTALFHKRFYPDDVDATIAWVAPIINGVDDPRFQPFLEQVGDADTREKIFNYQTMVLENRDEILPKIENYMNNSSLTYNVDPAIILEYEICEYPFAYWQFTLWPSENIPGSGSTIDELYQHLEEAGGFPLYSDEYRDYYSPVYYQAYTELGWYKLKNENLAGLLTTDPSYDFYVPSGSGALFRSDVMTDIKNWLMTEGNNIIYIYGGNDPWTAAAIENTGSTNSIKIVQPGADHSVRLADLDEASLVYSTLEEWLGISINGPGVIPAKLFTENKPVRLLK